MKQTEIHASKYNNIFSEKRQVLFIRINMVVKHPVNRMLVVNNKLKTENEKKNMLVYNIIIQTVKWKREKFHPCFCM